MKRNIVQVAGVLDRAEAEMLNACNVDNVAFPLQLDVHEEDADETAVGDMIRMLRPPSRPVLITYLRRAEEIALLCKRLGVRIVQLHGELVASELRDVKRLAADLFVIKSIVIGPDTAPDLSEAVDRYLPHTDAFITDTYDPATGASGATGKTHDWAVSRDIVQYASRPVILAGGLDPDNVRQAIAMVRPAGVDTHTGVENATGRKQRELVEAFVSEARDAFAGL